MTKRKARIEGAPLILALVLDVGRLLARSKRQVWTLLPTADQR